MEVTGMFVSPLVSLLIQNLAPVALSFIPSSGIDRKLKQWTKILETIEAVLEDAEVRQLEKPILLWLQDVRKLAFEIEDFVDDLATEAQRRQMIAAPESSGSGRIRKLTSRLNVAAIRFNYDMEQKIGKISTSLQELEKRKEILSLQKCVGGKSERTGDLRLPLTSSVVDPARVFGREEDCAAILTWLLEGDRTNDRDSKVSIISIVGMGGIGKTTLARSIYNNEVVKDYFGDRAWVCVTQEFDVLKISKIIYEEVSDENCTFNELNKVQVKLMEKLSNKKFLLVLDDVWNQDYAKWDLLCAPFHCGAPGSMIVVTTRNQDVAKTMGSKKVYNVKELSDEDCLSVLAHHALEKPNFNEHPEFKEVGEMIVKRCNGLPLAAKSLGGLLRTKGNPKQWKEVLNSKIWEIKNNGIIPALRLSYHHLPPDLKPLFAYCSIFPKAHEFDQQELIMLWMAQGFLRELGEEKRMEELGCEYFSELLSRSFFQHSTVNESRFVMHDLNNDLAQFVAGSICIRLDSEMESNGQHKVSEEARHASIISHKYDDFKKMKAFNATRCLRTILPIREKSLGISYLSNLALKDFPRLPYLRTLSFNGYGINELPNSIGNLNHLRYLDLSKTNIKELPKSICALSNLQTLLLYGCSNLVWFPTSIQKLINLRHLDIVGTASLKEMPLGISLLTHLRTLSKFIVDKSIGRKICELKNLHHLRGTISITCMENVMNVQDAMEANILGKEGLHGLEMKWSSYCGTGTLERGLEFDVLNALKPHIGLATLEIEFYGGLKFPSWIGHHSFCDMVEVRLIGCINCTRLPPLGQLTSLKQLYIEGMDGVKVVGPEFLGTGSPHTVAFRSLLDLSFRDMTGWEEWSANFTTGDGNFRAFPCLHEVKMSNCMKLNKISLAKIPSLVSLKLYDCVETVLRSMVKVGSVKKLAFGISGITKLDEGIIRCLGEVEDLSVGACKQLRYLWEEEVACQVLEKLKALDVHYCEQLESLGDKEQLLPHNLERLFFNSCDKLEKMPNWQNNLTSLRKLIIYGCNKLQDHAMGMAQSNSGGKHREYEFSNMEKVYVANCPSLKWFPTGKRLPTTLKNLSVLVCENMEAPEEGENGMSLSLPLLESIGFGEWSNLQVLPQGLTNLTRLEIWGCPGIESFPETSLAPTLTSLHISDCSNLKYMLCANEMQTLTSLRRMEITCCKNLEDYPSEGQWPPNLEILRMGDLKKPITEWGLATLPSSLFKLQLRGEFPQLISFREVGTQLPKSLTSFQIWRLKDLESLGKGLENLSSLQHLEVSTCPTLRELPKTLLPSLLSLQINGCPIVSERCKKEKRDYWPKISHIPRVEIDHQSPFMMIGSTTAIRSDIGILFQLSLAKQTLYSLRPIYIATKRECTGSLAEAAYSCGGYDRTKEKHAERCLEQDIDETRLKYV